MSRGLMLGVVAATLVALGLRCPELGRRPMHSDEAVNALKFQGLLERGAYRYDPNEHHGPTLPYSTLAWARLTDVSDFTRLSEARLRAVPVLFGLGLILLLPLVADGLGRRAVVFAAMLTALSPAMVYYARDYIHETLLACFTFVVLASGWRWYRSRKPGWALATGAAAGLMQSTKETFILPLAAMAVAFALNEFWARRRDATPAAPAKRAAIFGQIAAAAAAWLAVIVVFFTSFFTHAAGLVDAVRTYSIWFSRGTGESFQVHPWHFYLDRLAFFHAGRGPIWSEGLILGLAAVGIFAAFTHKAASDAHPGFLRFLAFYTIILTAIYSLIPYKTPWCLLGFWDGLILLAGVGAVAMFHLTRERWRKWLLAILLLAGGAQLGAQAWRAGVTDSAERTNPYAYAQTSPDILRLAAEFGALEEVCPQGRHMLAKVVVPGSDYWPLPWYLRGFDQVGWWSEMPADPFAPVMIISTKFNAALDTKGTHVMAGLFQLRPGAFVELYVESGLWRAYVDHRAREKPL